jgi:hypothetical protein
MGLALAVSRNYLPTFIRKSRLNDLFRAAVDAFRCEVPQLQGYSFDRCLTGFALFTSRNAQRCLQSGTQEEVKERLYNNAFLIGRRLRKELRVSTVEEVMQASGIIYKAIEIDFHGEADGQIEIPVCFFSPYYSDKICRVMSSMDEGLMAGLSGGLKLEFTQRITEGHECCKARLLQAGRPE